MAVTTLRSGDGPGARLHAIGDQPLHHTGRRQPGARLLKMLKVGGCRFELRLEALVPSPLAIERAGEDRQKHKHGGHDHGPRHG